MSPEQVEGRVADADAATDQFALAVVTYEMLTGRNPFQSDTVADIFSRVSQADPAAMGVGRDVELVVRRGLAKSNRQRFVCVTDFSAALRAAATGRVREGQRSATIAYAAGEIANFDNKGRSRRRKWGLALAAGAVVSLMISFTVGRAANDGPSRVRALFADPVAKEIPRRGESRGEETAASHETAPPVIVPLPAPEAIRPSPVALDTLPSQPRRKFSPAPSRRRVAAPFSVDEDATMPASDP
jgi:serine/threonine protein kinase